MLWSLPLQYQVWTSADLMFYSSKLCCFNCLIFFLGKRDMLCILPAPSLLEKQSAAKPAQPDLDLLKLKVQPLPRLWNHCQIGGIFESLIVLHFIMKYVLTLMIMKLRQSDKLLMIWSTLNFEEMGEERIMLHACVTMQRCWTILRWLATHEMTTLANNQSWLEYSTTTQAVCTKSGSGYRG